MEPQPSSRTVTATLLIFLEQRRWMLFAVAALLLCLPFNGRWRLGPDSTLYVSLARALAAGHGYHSLGWPRANAHFGLPVILSADIQLFGVATLWPALLLMLAFGLASLAMTYRLLLVRLPRPNAVAITLLVALSATFNAYLYELLTDTPGYLGVIAALLAFESLMYRPRRSWRIQAGWWLLLLGGLWLGAAMRPVTWALVAAMAAVLIGALLRNRSMRRPAILLLSLLLVGIVLFYAFDPRPSHAGEAHEAWLHRVLIERPRQTLDIALHHTLPMILGPTTVEACLSFSLGRLLSMPLALLLWIAALFAVRNHPLWRLWLVGNFIMLLIYPEPQTRYLLPVLPFLAMGFFQMAAALGRLPKRSLATTALTLCLTAWTIPGLARLGGLIYRQHIPPFLPAIDYGRYVPYQSMSDYLAASLPPNAVIVSDDALSLEAFHPDLHLMMLIDHAAAPDLDTEGPPALAQGRIYAVESNPEKLQHYLQQHNLAAGPPLFSVPRPAWEQPRFPERWLSPHTLPDLPPLVLRQIVTPPTTTAPTTNP